MSNPSAPPGKSLKYALVEWERRFLLDGLPAGANPRTTARIVDRYIHQTRLRLRRTVDRATQTRTVYKVTQKVPAAHGTGAAGLMTTIYLSAVEYEVLLRLPASELGKTRHRIPPGTIDVFDPPLAGLVLAEVEFDSDESMQVFEPPPFVVAEVTGDERFTGGRLASMTSAGLAELLSSFDVRR